MLLPGGVAMNSVQFEMESWTGAQRAFALKSFYKNNDSYVAAQHEFRKKFRIHRNSNVLSAHAIKTWVNNFKETGSTVKKKGGSVRTVHTPQNIDAVRASFEQSPRRSAVRHSKKLGLSESSVRHILHLDLHSIHTKFKSFRNWRRVMQLKDWFSVNKCWT
jgi:transposase